ncbi:MAG: MmgE/PrpD family protein [Alphaproteobacteria bacterium]|nr:MmgE/PrpD family protein [Alphaproteobacteria bacterium]
MPPPHHPNSRAGRTHSIPYCVAAALLKPIRYEDFNEPYCRDLALTQLIPKIDVVEDSEITKAYPAKSKCTITITLADSSTIHGERDYP